MKLLIIPLLLAATTALAQGTVDDYRRAASLRQRYAGKVAGGDVQMHVRPGTHTFWYSVSDGQGNTLYKEVDADRRTVATLPENPEPPRPRHHDSAPQRHWMEVPDEKDGWQQSPVDTALTIFHRDNNLWTLRNGKEQQLTTDGTPTAYYSSWGTFSPDGTRYATVLITPAPKHYVHYVESSPSGRLEPVLHRQEYAKPGDSLNVRIPVVVDVATGHAVSAPREQLTRQYEVTAPQWDADGRTLTFEYNHRGHKRFEVVEMDAATGALRTLIDESDDKYVAYTRLKRRDLSDGRRILWTSDRDGHGHIYLYDRRNPSRPRQLTRGEYYVRDIVHIDEKRGEVYFTACGMNKQEDPYLIHYYRIGLDGRRLTCLTPEEGSHSALFTDDMQYLVDTYSTITNPPVTVLRRAADGKVLMTLEEGDITRLAAEGWRAPEVFVAKGRDDKTDMWGIIMRPQNFDPSRSYPVIEYIYSGPGDQYVPKTFRPWIWGMAELAELGFIVVQLDAMTTSWRSKDFEQVCYKNLADAGFPDRIRWIKAAAEQYSYIDTTRVGIYGCSAGGQNALAALLWHGDFYKAAYAACGCHDNRMDKIWWNEQWMSWPVDSTYAQCSNVENAWRLNRPLMLCVGEMDDNVDPASTMQVASALQKAGKDFELVVIPGARHTMGEAFGEHKRNDFFVRELLGVKPPKWDLVQ